MPPVRAANLVTYSGNTAYGVDVILLEFSLMKWFMKKCWNRVTISDSDWLWLIGPWEIWMKFKTSNIQFYISDWQLIYLLWNCPEIKGVRNEISWWRYQIETFSALLAICAGNSPVPGEFPAQRPVTRSVEVFFDLRLKRLSKQSWGWWFETLYIASITTSL